VVGSLLTLTGVARTWSEWDTGRALTYVVLAALTASAVGMGALHVVQDRRRHDSIVIR
jgi:hypothetical protein